MQIPTMAAMNPPRRIFCDAGISIARRNVNSEKKTYDVLREQCCQVAARADRVGRDVRSSRNLRSEMYDVLENRTLTPTKFEFNALITDDHRRSRNKFTYLSYDECCGDEPYLQSRFKQPYTTPQC